MKKIVLSIVAVMLSFMIMGCSDYSINGGSFNTGWTPEDIPDDPVTPTPTPETAEKAPLYWTVYEYGRLAEKNGTDCNMPKEVWQKNIDWVAENLLPYGYDMICTDGFMAMLGDDNAGHPYMTSYAHIPLTELIQMCKDKGLKLGIYDNPLWVHGSLDCPIEGTKYTVRNLLYEQGKDQVKNPDADGDIFTWIVPSHKGGKEYIDGFFKYYKSIGVDFIRMDFMCLFEDGIRGGGTKGEGRGYGSAEYRLALQYIAEAAQKYGVFTSIVMPNMKDHGQYEAQYGNMVRIVDDACEGGWDHLSSRWRGAQYIKVDLWPAANNQFDGFTYWSDITGRGKVIADGDFQLMRRFNSDDERRSCITLQLMAGGPIAVADEYNTIGYESGENSYSESFYSAARAAHNVSFYQNEEVLELNKDKFVGKPLSNNISTTRNGAGIEIAEDANSQVWYGQMSNGDYIVALFNRENIEQERGVELSALGISGSMKVRDLWTHTDEGEVTKVSAKLAPHACKVVRLSKPE